MTGETVVLDPEAREIAILTARFAALGFRLVVDARAREWRVSGAGGKRTFHGQVEAADFLERQERAA